MDQINTDIPKQANENALQRKPYETPTMTDFGSVAELTRGSFSGVGADNGVYS